MNLLRRLSIYVADVVVALLLISMSNQMVTWSWKGFAQELINETEVLYVGDEAIWVCVCSLKDIFGVLGPDNNSKERVSHVEKRNELIEGNFSVFSMRYPILRVHFLKCYLTAVPLEKERRLS